MSFKEPSDLPDTERTSSADEGGDAAALVAEVSHELRLPIANMRLLVETLLDGALEDKEVCRRMLKRAYQEVERLQALVNDLLSLEQVSPSRRQLYCQPVNLLERARYASDSVATTALSKQVAIELQVEPEFSIYANKEQLDQVLLNLVENAVKFTQEGGRVTIKSGPEPGSFSVADTGIGIAEQDIPKIFQRFYRVDRNRSKGSSGLGLSIVKNIAEMHGARISVESSEGRGSCFKLEFPPARHG